MLQHLVNWSLHRRGVVVLLAAALTGAGYWAAVRSPLDVFPEFAPPLVIVQTEAPGFTTEQVETLVTVPLENVLHGTAGLQRMTSESAAGISVLTLFFEDNVDIRTARQQTTERLGEIAGTLPKGVDTPRLTPMVSTTGKLMTVGLTSPSVPPMEMRALARRTIIPRLLAVRGIAQVTLFGGEERQFQIQIDPAKLLAAGLTTTDVTDAAQAATGLRGAGFIETRGQRIILNTEGRISTIDDLRRAVIRSENGRPVRLGDVATVVEGAQPKAGDGAAFGRRADGRVFGGPGLLMVVYKQPGFNSLEVTARLEAALDAIRTDTLDRLGIDYHRGMFRQADGIEHAILGMEKALLIGAALVAAVLFLFQMNWRTSLISVTAIPLSLLGGVALLSVFGIPMNTLTLGGLAIAIGEVVDDAVVDVENIHRRLRQNAAAGRPLSNLRTVLAASLEVRSSVVYATLLVVIVCLPVFFLSGVMGRLFSPLAWAYLLSVMVSLGVALTITPALCLLLLGRESTAPGDVACDGSVREPFLLRMLQHGYEAALRGLAGVWWAVTAAAVLLVAGAAMLVPQLKGELLPELREDHLIVHLRAVPGTSLPECMRIGSRMAAELMELPIRFRLTAASLEKLKSSGVPDATLAKLQPLTDQSFPPPEDSDEARQKSRRTEPTLQERLAGMLTSDELARWSAAIARQAKVPLVRSVTQMAGRAELGEDTWDVSYTEMEVAVTPAESEAEAVRRPQAIKEVLDRYPGVTNEVVSFLKERMDETIGGAPGDFVVRVYGEDWGKLDLAGERVAKVLADVKGSAEVAADSKGLLPQLNIRVRSEDASRFGLRNVDVLEAVRTAYQGFTASQIYSGILPIDIVVLLDARLRTDPDAVRKLPLNAPGGGRVLLGQVADVTRGLGRPAATHEAGRRCAVIHCKIGDRDIDAFAEEAMARVRRELDDHVPGVSPEFSGKHEARATAFREMLLLSAGLLVGFVVMLQLALRSARSTLLVLLNLPFAFVGGVAAAYLSGGTLNVGVLVGFVTLFGITTRNSIMMLTHWQHLYEHEGVPWGPGLIVRGARERLAPVLMTALVTALGLLPVALGGGQAGREIEAPMAIVILGGIGTSVVLNLLVLPGLMQRFGRASEPAAD